ncbi:MAG: LysR substrate-binding domain-containing protein [Pseudomonadota bacterium]
MNIRDLEYVIAVADLRSFSKAAAHCSVSQPTLSLQVKKLEESLGVTLFERNNKHVLPTDIGQHIVQSARRVLQETDQIKELATSAQDPLAGRYRLGIIPTLASYILPDLVPLVKERLPELRLVFAEDKSEELHEKLHNGTIDAAFLALPLHDSFLTAEHLFDDPFLLAVNASHQLADLSCVGTGILNQHSLMLLEEGHCFRDQALSVCELLGVGDRTDLSATSLETLRQMVRADTGITLMPQIAISEPDPHIKYIPFLGTPPFRSIGLARRKTPFRQEVFNILCEITANAFGGAKASHAE